MNVSVASITGITSITGIAMFIGPVCVSCGLPTGDIYDLYLLYVEEIRKRDGPDAPLGEALDRVGIRRECCRSHMLTAINFYDTLYGYRVR